MYDARRRALFGSVFSGTAAQWFDSLNPGLNWNEIRDQFINRFTDAKGKYRKRIEVEHIKRQPDELLPSFIHRLTKIVEKGWPDPEFNNNYRTIRCMEKFCERSNPPPPPPPSLKQKAHQLLTENPATTWQNLQDQMSNKYISYSMSSEFYVTSSNSIDNKLEIQEMRQELSRLLKDHKINATYNNNKQTENPTTSNWVLQIL